MEEVKEEDRFSLGCGHSWSKRQIQNICKGVQKEQLDGPFQIVCPRKDTDSNCCYRLTDQELIGALGAEAYKVYMERYKVLIFAH